jgi:general stress protein 26
MTNENTNHEKDILKLNDLISGIKVCMLTTLASDGKLHSRPMWTQQTDFDGNLWFFTSIESPKAQELEKDYHVTLGYAQPKNNCYVSVYGDASLLRDRAKMEELWNPAFLAWFPEGLNDPKLTLIKVQVERAEYWDSPSSKVVHLIGFVKALTTGKPYKPGKDEHGKLEVAG